MVRKSLDWVIWFHFCNFGTPPLIFSFRKQLTGHKREVHIRGQDEAYKTSLSVECDICKKVMASKYVLRKHKKLLHSDLKVEYECYICGEKRANKYSLSNHILTHRDRCDRQQFECIGKTRDKSKFRYFSYSCCCCIDYSILLYIV